MKSTTHIQAGISGKGVSSGRRFMLLVRVSALLAVSSLAPGCISAGSLGNPDCAGAVQTRLGCITVPEQTTENRLTDSRTKPGPLTQAYEQRVEALVANHLSNDTPSVSGIWADDRDSARIDDAAGRRFRHRSAKAGELVSNGAPPMLPVDTAGPGTHHFDKPWRKAAAYLFIDSPKKAGPPGRFAFSGVQALETTIFLRSITKAPLNAAVICDGRAVFHTANGARTLEPGEATGFSLAPMERDKTRLISPAGTDHCLLDILGAAGGAARRITIDREEDVYASLADLDSRYEICAVPPASEMTALENVFFRESWLSKGCVEPVKAVRLIPDSRDGFNAKIEALTGSTLSQADFDAGDPGLTLDFSRAPRIDLIIASYLDIKADFSGAIFIKALRHHAALGTPVRILTTDILELPKDRLLIEKLAADFPNVQLQEFAWKPGRNSNLGDWVNALHRTNHVKMLATLARDKSRSRLILGGRNIHDGFLFDEALDLSGHPHLHSYNNPTGLTMNYFASYRDLDMEISSDRAIRRFVAQLSTLWHRDPETNVARPYSMSVPSGTVRTGMRHFISVPYADNKALERWYVDLIDAATETVEIATPYLNPTSAIVDALLRARARNVAVVILARVNLHGDIGGRILTNLNKLFIEKYADLFDIHEYRPPKSLLHAKIIMIDRQLSIVSSVNLNNRSFRHDTENGVAVLDKAFYRRLNAVYDHYHSRSTALTTKVDIPPWYRMLFRVPGLRGAL
jgi:cardiolipin synthase